MADTMQALRGIPDWRPLSGKLQQLVDAARETLRSHDLQRVEAVGRWHADGELRFDDLTVSWYSGDGIQNAAAAHYTSLEDDPDGTRALQFAASAAALTLAGAPLLSTASRITVSIPVAAASVLVDIVEPVTTLCEEDHYDATWEHLLAALRRGPRGAAPTAQEVEAHRHVVDLLAAAPPAGLRRLYVTVAAQDAAGAPPLDGPAAEVITDPPGFADGAAVPALTPLTLRAFAYLAADAVLHYVVTESVVDGMARTTAPCRTVQLEIDFETGAAHVYARAMTVGLRPLAQYRAALAPLPASPAPQHDVAAP